MFEGLRGRREIRKRQRLEAAAGLVDAGASLPEVQRLFGHADLSTT